LKINIFCLINPLSIHFEKLVKSRGNIIYTLILSVSTFFSRICSLLSFGISIQVSNMKQTQHMLCNRFPSLVNCLGLNNYITNSFQVMPAIEFINHLEIQICLSTKCLQHILILKSLLQNLILVAVLMEKFILHPNTNMRK